MNSAIKKTIDLYMNQFMEMVSERFDISKEQLEDLWEESQKKKPPKKMKKKKTLTAYNLFCNERRSNLKSEYPEMTFIDLSKELGRQWRSLNEQEKQVYIDRKNQQMEVMALPPPEPPADMADPPLDDPETQEAQLVIVEEKAPKKSRKPADKMPADLDDHQRELWDEFSKFKMNDLRKQCVNNNLKTSKLREDMIMALITHRIALEEGGFDLSDRSDHDTDVEDDSS